MCPVGPSSGRSPSSARCPSSANEKTLRRALANTLANVEAEGLSGNFEIVRIEGGVPAIACMFAHAGILLFSSRA